MRAWLAIIISALLLSPPAVAADHQVVAVNGDIYLVKATFKQRHPRIYKGYRMVRTVCVKLNPLVSFCGSACQIVTAFR